MQITIRNVRIAFAEGIFTAKENDKGQLRYSATFLFPQGGSVEKQVADLVEKVGSEFFKDRWEKVKKEKKANNRLVLHDGDVKTHNGFEGNTYLVAYNTGRPTLRDADGKTPIVKEDGKIYSGCYTDAILDISAYNNKNHGDTISVTLMGVQFRRHGDAFSAAPQAKDSDFIELTDGADAEDLV